MVIAGSVRLCVLLFQLRAAFDLPAADPRSHGLSGIAWDDRARILYAISDHPPTIIELIPDRDLRRFSFGRTLARLRGDIDGEGIALARSGFFIADENGHVYPVDARGRLGDELRLPTHFARLRHNVGTEALGATPDRGTLFVANEQALDGDGGPPTTHAGTLVRLLRIDLASGAMAEYAYLTDPLPGEGGDVGVTEATPLSPTQVLVTERGFLEGTGNRIRIYRVDLSRATDILGRERLDARTPVVAKSLLVDFATLEGRDLPPSLAPQENRVLDNFEGVALGPRLPGGRQLLFAISDDNYRRTQVARIVVIEITP